MGSIPVEAEASTKVQGASSQRLCGRCGRGRRLRVVTRIPWIGRRQSARGCLWGEGVEISDQVVSQFYLGCEMNVGACDGVGGEVVKLGVYRVCYGVKKRVGGPLEVYRVE